MKLRKEKRIEKRTHQTNSGPIERNHEVEELVFDLQCSVAGCKEIGGEVRFPIEHGRKSDQHLEDELKALYSHTCDAHSAKI